MTSKCPRAVMFDLDNTLAESFKPPAPEVAERLHALLGRMPVGIISGASIDRMHQYLLPSIQPRVRAQLYLFPDTGAQCFRWQGGTWEREYREAFTDEQLQHIVSALKEGIEKTGIVRGAPLYGERILADTAQVTFAGIGIDAAAPLKKAWDPDRSKRAKLKAFLDPRLPGFDVRISARTAIDITKSGVDKAFGVRWLATHIGVKPSEMLFVGDDLSPGGNDAVVIPTGIQTRQLAGPQEASAVIDEILAACA